MTRPRNLDSLSPEITCIPAFQLTLSHWSPPPSPTSLSPMAQTPLPAQPPASPLKSTSQNIANALFMAACAGDFHSMQSALLEGGPSIINSSVLVPGIFEAFAPPKSGHLSPLAGAASHGQFQVVKYLLANGADISPSNSRSASSPLHQACRSNNLPIVRHLLQHGADVNQDNAYKVTPIMYACKYSSVEIVELLLAYSPDLHKTNFIGSTALSWAIFPGKIHVAELLLQAGADPNQAMPDGNTSLHCAVLTGSASMVKVFLRGGADPFLRNEMGLTPLRLAEEALQSGYEDGENQYDGGCCSSRSSRSNHHHNREKIVAMLKTVIAMCGHGGHQLRLRQRQRERQQQQ